MRYDFPIDEDRTLNFEVSKVHHTVIIGGGRRKGLLDLQAFLIVIGNGFIKQIGEICGLVKPIGSSVSGAQYMNGISIIFVGFLVFDCLLDD